MRAHKQAECIVVPSPLVAVWRNHRLAPKTTHLEAFEDLSKMEGEEESTETKTEDEYNPGEFPRPAPWMHFLGLWVKLLVFMEMVDAVVFM